MRLIVMGSLLMLGGLFLLFAMVVGSVEPGLLLSLGAYSLVIVGLMFAGFGLAEFVEGRRR